MLLNNKYWVAIGICNQLSLGLGVLENKEHYHEKYTQRSLTKNIIVVYQRKKEMNEKGTNNENSE